MNGADSGKSHCRRQRSRTPRPANMSLELTPSVGALEWLVTPVGICSSIESFWERSSAPSR